MDEKKTKNKTSGERGAVLGRWAALKERHKIRGKKGCGTNLAGGGQTEEKEDGGSRRVGAGQRRRSDNWSSVASSVLPTVY